MQGRVIEPDECRTVMRLLYLKRSTLKEALDEMKVVYGEDAPSLSNTDMVSSSAVKHQ